MALRALQSCVCVFVCVCSPCVSCCCCVLQGLVDNKTLLAGSWLHKYRCTCWGYAHILCGWLAEAELEVATAGTTCCCCIYSTYDSIGILYPLSWWCRVVWRLLCLSRTAVLLFCASHMYVSHHTQVLLYCLQQQSTMMQQQQYRPPTALDTCSYNTHDVYIYMVYTPQQ